MFSRLLTFAPIITEESTLLTIPVAFIYLSPFPVGNDLCVVPFRFAMWNGTQAVPYNNFTNYAVSICKQAEIIPLKRKTPLQLAEEFFSLIWQKQVNPFPLCQ